MSEQQDIIDLIEDVVIVDSHPRLEEQPFHTVRRYITPIGFVNGRNIGQVGVYEGERIAWCGLDVDEKGDLVVVARIHESHVTDGIDADKVHINAVRLSAVPDLVSDIDRVVRQETDHASLLALRNEIKERTRGKSALIEVCQRYLKEGRRAALEELHERADNSAEEFYSKNDSFGIF